MKVKTDIVVRFKELKIHATLAVIFALPRSYYAACALRRERMHTPFASSRAKGNYFIRGVYSSRSSRAPLRGECA